MKESSRIQTLRERMSRLEKQCGNCLRPDCIGCKVDMELADLKFSVETGHLGCRKQRRYG